MRRLFKNPHIQDLKRNIFNAILWAFGYYNEKQPKEPLREDFQYPIQSQSFDSSRPSCVWIGHSTFLISIQGMTFLTDPLFSEYCSPIHIRLFKRRHVPALKISELPPIDYVLISHNHYDHLDEKSVCELKERFPEITWIVPTGVKKWFQKRGIDRVIELNWNESADLNDRCKIHAVPSQHFSGRKWWDQNRSLWCGFVVECHDKIFYFVGDTGYNDVDFRQIGKKWPSIDLSLIPIGTYIPKKFMQPVHINPKEAVQIHLDVGSHLSLGMHWNTFCLSEEPLNRPPYDLYLAMQEKNLPFHTFLPIEIGKFVNW